jgi:hypothetical protein
MNWMPAEDAHGIGDPLWKETVVKAGRATEKGRETMERLERCTSSPGSQLCGRSHRSLVGAARNREKARVAIEEDVFRGVNLERPGLIFLDEVRSDEAELRDMQEKWELEGVEHACETEMQPCRRAGGQRCSESIEAASAGCSMCSMDVDHVVDFGAPLP